MLKELLEAIKVREESIDFVGRKVRVVELAAGADLGAPADPKEPHADLGWRLLVRCVLDAETSWPVFQDDDIPDLRKGSKHKLAPLINAVERVNGLSGEDNAKNSQAVQS